jgi:signal peptidase II
MTKRVLRTLIIFAILLCNFGCDRISKIVVRQTIDHNEQITFLNDHLTLMKVENSGAFLSLGNSMSHPLRFIFLSIIPLLVLGYGLFFLLTHKHVSKVTLTGICFVLGGGLGNVFDRIVYGSVTDFLHIDFGIFQTGVFNLADVSIMAGMLLIVFDYFKGREPLNETGDQLP